MPEVQETEKMARGEEYTLGFTAANSYALLLSLPLIATFIVPYALIYGWGTLGADLPAFLVNIPLFLVSVLLGTVVHEFIHAVCWSWLDGIPWNRIEFGIKWKLLTPYVHCPESVEINNYRWGVAMPGIVLGLLPYLLALVLQNGWLLGFGIFFTLAAGGDLLILWLLRNVERGSKVQDHPDLIGCQVVEETDIPG
ncbi:MAG: DUF3267 domain-containing protein [Fodinibius sp.]|nr:DUF3267 domain-containing protein [Fodinibius sp.]